jgi:phosphoesterase RecJ-like protein
MKNDTLQYISGLIKQAGSLALICHIRPDGDTLGAALALYNYIAPQKKCAVYCDDALPRKYDFLKGFDKITSADIDLSCDLVICLDCSDLKRTGKYAAALIGRQNVVNIDHHISNEKYAEINYVADASSTCEIVFTLLKTLGAKPDKDIYACIYCGLSSDTGNFSHSNTTSAAFSIAAELSGAIGDISFINYKIFKEIPLNKLQLLAVVLKDVKIFADGKIALLTVKSEDVTRYGCDVHDTEGFVDYAINIQDVEIGAILLESEKNCYKVSLRSKTANVCRIAAQFGGGGHIHAAGCMICGQYDEVVDKLVKNAEFYL